MTESQLTSTLRRLYTEENNRIVFWYDADREFEDGLVGLKLDGVKIVRLDEMGALELKILLELRDTTGKYLIYAPFPEPNQENDWLLDIRLYSRTFHADQASMLISELGLTQLSLRPYLAEHRLFFSKDRISRLKKWVKPEDTESDLDLKMLAVLSRADQADIFSILMKLFGELRSQDEQPMLIPSPTSWTEIEKYNLAGSFWRLMAETFGYSEEKPGISDLLIRLLVTDLANTMKGSVPLQLQHFVMRNQGLSLTASVFTNHWRSNVSQYTKYNELSGAIAGQLKIKSLLVDLDENRLRDAMTFEEVEQQIIRCLLSHVIEGHFDLNNILEWVRHRLDGHWASQLVAASGTDYRTIYIALKSAAELLDLRNKYHEGLSYPDADAMYAAYTRELFRFDQLYRLFHESASQVELSGSDILKGLSEVVEKCYSGWFIDQLAVTWGRFVEPRKGTGLLQEWRVNGIPNQQDFYSSHVEPALKAYPKGRVYVIISDALRYEVAEELTRELNTKSRVITSLASQLGVLPSYTSLGMAALLPHKTLDFKTNGNADILEVNGQPTSSLEQRSNVLAEVQGKAVKAEELRGMGKDGGREFVKPWRVIYVYHNQIDATGDSASTESSTFSSVRTAIKELSALASYIIDTLNGSQVFITADHGFLFQEIYPGQHEKSGLDSKPSGTLKAKKRYLLGNNLGDAANAWHGDTRVTAGTENPMEFWVPKGANRFHFAGGARYFHGGAMLQEIVVPVLSVKGIKVGEPVRKVGVSLLGSIRKIVNNVQRFEFIQTEAVSDRVLPVTLIASLRDGDRIISNEVSLTFDSASEQMDERKKTANIIIKAGKYDNKKEYYIVLQEKDTKIEYERLTVTIDLAFINEF